MKGRKQLMKEDIVKWLVDSIRQYLDKRRGDREKLAVTSIPIFVSFHTEKRDFFIKIATIAATIGAFSFLLFDSAVLKSPPLLIFGDLILLLVIVASLALYTYELRNSFYDFHDMYYSVFESQNREIQTTQKFLRREISKEDYDKFLKAEIDKIPEYNRPSKSGFLCEWLIIGILSIALLLMAFSFSGLKPFPPEQVPVFLH